MDQPMAVQLALDGDAAATAVAHSAAADRTAACSHTTGQVRVWGVSPAGGALTPLLHDARVPGGPRVLAWAPGEHGSVLAVGTGAGSVHFFVAGDDGGWSDSGPLPCGRGAVTDAAFAPWQLGLLLAASSADGHVYVYEGSPSCGGGAGAAAATGDDPSNSSSNSRRSLSWTLHSRFAAALPTAAAAAAALLPSAAAPSPCGCVAWRGGHGSPPLLLAGSGPGAGAAVWAYDPAAMAWRRAVALEEPDEDEEEEGERGRGRLGGGREAPQTARACAWAPALGREDEMVAVALGSGDVALYRLLAAAGGAFFGGGREGGGGGGAGGARGSLRPAQTLRHRSPATGAKLSAWRVQFNATGTALAASVEGAAEGVGEAEAGDEEDHRSPPQVWFWMPNLESGVWRAVASVEGGEEGDGGGGGGGVGEQMMLGAA